MIYLKKINTFLNRFPSLGKGESLLYFGLIFLLIFIPLYPKIPTFNIPGTYVAIRVEDFLIAAIFSLWILLNVKNLKFFSNQLVFKIIFLFWAIGFLSLISALTITYSVKPNLGFLHWLRRVEYMSLFLVAATSIKTLKQIKILILTFLTTSFLVILYGFGQIYLAFPVISTTNKEFSKGLLLTLNSGARVNSTFAGHYDLPVYLSMIVMLTGALFFYRTNKLARSLFFLLGVLSFGLLGITASRTTFVSTVIALILLFILLNKKILVATVLATALALVVLVPDLRHRLVATITVNLLGGGGAKYTPAPDKITIYTDLSRYPLAERERLKKKALAEATKSASQSAQPPDTAPGEPVNSTELGVYRSYGIRINVEWPRAIRAFLKNPFLGTGYSSITLATDNDLLRSLGEVGLLGTLALVLLMSLIIKNMWKIIRDSSGFIRFLTVGLLMSVATVLITGLFIDVFEASKIAEIFWLLMGAFWAIISIHKKNYD